ncbi:flagellar assembly protein FliH [Gracilibacillus sp. YIM 98692]|uniref:flagellar assembly protein FliH n=1 Tax=Gracilibacillus sp. YIM 98692 TaxID=2663532 RepID=UPI0013D47FAC|nr:flagellar assembly protein FliH [Gracilibacillus sp. YIM 98692]
MSKSFHKPLKSKTIQIKPIGEPEREDNTSFEETKLEKLKDQIEESEEKLKTVQKEIDDKKIKAEKEIQKLRDNWEKEKKAYIEDAQSQGYQAGFEQGEKDSLERYQTMIQEANQNIELAKKDYANIISQSNESILRIALTVAEKIINQTIEEDQEKFIRIVQAAIEQVKEHPEIILFVHSNDYSLVLEHKEELQSVMLDQTGLWIYVDSTLEAGQVKVETSFGTIDASIDKQLEELKKHLFHIVEEISRGDRSDH